MSRLWQLNNGLVGRQRSCFHEPLIHEVETMNMKHLSHTGIVGLLLAAFAPAAIAGSEQLRRTAADLTAATRADPEPRTHAV